MNPLDRLIQARAAVVDHDAACTSCSLDADGDRCGAGMALVIHRYNWAKRVRQVNAANLRMGWPCLTPTVETEPTLVRIVCHNASVWPKGTV